MYEEIEGVQYISLQAAIDAVKDGETITLLGAAGSENKEIEYTKAISFTITGSAPEYALPVITFQKATVNIKPVEGLRISGFAAVEEGDNRSFWFNKTINTDQEGSGKAGRGSNFNVSKLFEVTADYSRTFGQHHVAGVAGFSYQNFYNDGESISNKGFPTEGMKYYQIGNGDAEKTYLKASSYRNSNTLAAAFLRANYNFAEKYLVSASVRREGSSRFGANHKWGWFPAVSLGWRISGENFMRNQDWCNDLKLRAGFGVTGNNLGSDLRSVAMLSNGGTFWYNGADEIYEAIIGYRTEVDQYIRNSVILEEIYNGLGPVQDTDLREDSIIYAGYSEPQELTQADELILRLFYAPK